jgi:hypothetical protein
VSIFGNAPNRQVVIDGVGSKWGGAVNFKWSYRKLSRFEASLNGKRCKLLNETYDWQKTGEKPLTPEQDQEISRQSDEIKSTLDQIELQLKQTQKPQQ